jgi:hypothetical protein
MAADANTHVPIDEIIIKVPLAGSSARRNVGVSRKRMYAKFIHCTNDITVWLLKAKPIFI